MAQSLATATRGKLNPTDIELAYMAGVIDSDGSISISKMANGLQRTKNPRYVLSVNIVNTSQTLMQWMIEKVGGRVKPRRKVKEHHKITYDWFYSNAKAVDFLKLILPFLIVKKDRALIAIELIDKWVTPQGGQGSKTNPEEVQRREALWQEMKRLNQFGERSRND